MKKTVILLISLVFITSCTDVAKFPRKDFIALSQSDPVSWTIDDCDKIIGLFSFSNFDFFWNDVMGLKLGSTDIKITAVLLNKLSLAAISRKEALLQRLPEKDFYSNLKFNLEDYTRFTLDKNNKIVENASLPKDSSKGISFNLYFKNLTEPYRSVELENGYNYFFLENPEGKYSRVIGIRGTYVDYNFILSDYLRVTITYSEFDDEGEKLFEDSDNINDVTLIFNAIAKEPVILKWKLHLRLSP